MGGRSLQFFYKNKGIVAKETIRTMDESEYDQYLKDVERIYRETARLGETELLDRVYDNEGFGIPGCYRTLPVATEE